MVPLWYFGHLPLAVPWYYGSTICHNIKTMLYEFKYHCTFPSIVVLPSDTIAVWYSVVPCLKLYVVIPWYLAKYYGNTMECHFVNSKNTMVLLSLQCLKTIACYQNHIAVYIKITTTVLVPWYFFYNIVVVYLLQRISWYSHSTMAKTYNRQ